VCASNTVSKSCGLSTPDWSKVDANILQRYESVLYELLNQVDVPVSLLSSECVGIPDNQSFQLIDNYYNNIVSCIRQAVQLNIPHSIKGHSYSDHAIAGWNDIVKDKHCAARAAYLDWVTAGRPRQGPVLLLMNRTRAAFKLAIRYCKQHEDRIRSDNMANSLADKDYKAFWKSVHKRIVMGKLLNMLQLWVAVQVKGHSRNVGQPFRAVVQFNTG